MRTEHIQKLHHNCYLSGKIVTMYQILKYFLFLLSPEKAHHFTTGLLSAACLFPGMKGLLQAIYRVDDQRLSRKVAGLTFKNPVGLAAGFDKDAKYIDQMGVLGFGFIEIGTVTPKPQPGNPKPRLFRLLKDHALINRMGFNNDGVEAAAARLKHLKKTDVIIGGNIGKNKVTPNDKAVEDYKICCEELHPYIDYFVVNVSSPNTPGLRELQGKDELLGILNAVSTVNKSKGEKPVFLKIAPDMEDVQLDDVLEVVKQVGIAGIIATNTTVSRAHLKSADTKVEQIGNGGLSGAPLTDRSTEVISYLRKNGGDQLAIIGVGGIDSAQDAIDKINAGADLVQVYTGLIYEGPALVKHINQELAKIELN